MDVYSELMECLDQPVLLYITLYNLLYTHKRRFVLKLTINYAITTIDVNSRHINYICGDIAEALQYRSYRIVFEDY